VTVIVIVELDKMIRSIHAPVNQMQSGNENLDAVACLSVNA